MSRKYNSRLQAYFAVLFIRALGESDCCVTGGSARRSKSNSKTRPETSACMKTSETVISFLSRVRISILASDDLDLGCCHDIITFHLEGWVLDDEGPNIVAQAICMEVAFERSLCLD